MQIFRLNKLNKSYEKKVYLEIKSQNFELKQELCGKKQNLQA